MKKSKILVRVNNLLEVEEYKKLGISNFLFAIKEFSIGYDTFTLDELCNLNVNVYVLLNRVLDNNDIDSIRKIKDKFNFVKGIIFEDIGIYQLFKDTNINLIWNQAHFAVSTSSVNYWLGRVNSVVLSNELEKEELKNLLNNVKNKVILPVFGLNMAMYSRRYLLSFFNEYNKLKKVNKAILETLNKKEFLAVENKYGTVLFYSKYFNLIPYLDEFNDESILFYYVDANGIDANMFEKLLLNDSSLIEIDNRFFETKTVYRIGDLDD